MVESMNRAFSETGRRDDLWILKSGGSKATREILCYAGLQMFESLSRTRCSRFVTSPLMALALVATAQLAQASPFEDTTNGGAVFTGPVHAHPTSVLINPAALGIGGVQQYVYLGVSAHLDRYNIQRNPILDPNADPEAGPRLTPTTWAPGGLLAVQIKAGNSAILAAAFSLPVYESFISGEENLGYHVLGGHHRRWSGTLATAVRLTNYLYVGASLSGSSTDLALSFYRDTALEAGRSASDGGVESTDCGGAVCGIENPEAAELWDVNVASEGFIGTQTLSIRVGAAFQVRKGWWLGASYHSPPGLQAPVSLRGDVTIDRAPRDRTGDPTVDQVSGNAEIVYKLPQTVTLGVRGPVTESLQVLAHTRWETLSRQRVLDLQVFGRDLPDTIPEWYPRYRGLSDSLSFTAGVETFGLRRWLLGGRIRLEWGGTDDAAVSPLQVAGFNVNGAFGAELRISQNVVLAASGGVSWYPTTTVKNSDYNPLERLDCVGSDFEVSTCTSTVEGRAIASADGTYGRFTAALRTSLRVYWD